MNPQTGIGLARKTPPAGTGSRAASIRLRRDLQHEVGQRRHIDRALRLAEHRYLSIFEHALEGIFQTTKEGQYMAANPALVKMYGYGSFDELAKNVNNIATQLYVDPKRRAEFIRIMQEHGKVLHFESEVRRQDGKTIWISENVRSIHDEAGEFLYYEGTVDDITERRQSEERLRQQAALLAQAHDAILVRDLDERIVYWNKGAERLYGWSAEEALSKRADELFSIDNSKIHEEARRLLLLKGEWVGELRQVSKSGRELFVESRRTLLRDEQGNPKSILVINTDITERKEVEGQLLRTQRLESIGTLAGGVAHDLNNALTPILMASKMLRMRYPDATDMIDIVEAGAQRGADMVKQLLTYSKGVEGERIPLQSQLLLKEIEKLIRGTFPKNIQLQTRYAKQLPAVVGDSTQLHQVLLNVCINARDAMPNGGTLTLKAETMMIDTGSAGAVREAKPGPYVVWRVEDTGLGIPAEILDRIFEPFFSTKGPDKGTGLGLSTVIGIVKSHGGFVRVNSAPGEGSAFAIYLPADLSSAGHSPLRTQAEPAFRSHGETILVVDDEPAVRELMRTVLTALDFKVLTASDGTTGLLQVADMRTELHAVITDVHMPGMDGLDFVRVLRAQRPQVSIVVASGYLDELEKSKFETLGISAVLDKPFTQEKLVEALKTIFRKSK